MATRWNHGKLMSLIAMVSMASMAQGLDDSAMHFFDAVDNLEVGKFPENFMDSEDLMPENPCQHLSTSKVMHLNVTQ